MSEFVSYLHEVFARFGPIETRRMFGGHGIYRDQLMFALVVDDVLYLKADRESAAVFESAGASKFAYQRSGKAVNLNFYSAPEEIFDDAEQAQLWATKAFEAALRAHSGRRRGATRKKAKGSRPHKL